MFIQDSNTGGGTEPTGSQPAQQPQYPTLMSALQNPNMGTARSAVRVAGPGKGETDTGGSGDPRLPPGTEVPVPGEGDPRVPQPPGTNVTPAPPRPPGTGRLPDPVEPPTYKPPRREAPPTVPGELPPGTEPPMNPPPGNPRPPPPDGGGGEPPTGGTPPEPAPPGNPGGGGTPGAGGGRVPLPTRTGGAGGPTYSPRPMGAGDLGVPGGSAGSFKNIQQFLKTNAPAEAEFAQKNFVAPLAAKAEALINDPKNIPTQTEYEAAKYPGKVPGVGDRPTQVGPVTLPELKPEPGFLGGPQAWREHADSEIAYNAAVDRQKKQDEDYASAMNRWEKEAIAADAANAKLIESGKMGPQPGVVGKAADVGYQLGTGASPTGYGTFLGNRGISGGARKLDEYLYGATPGGAQQDTRDLQQRYGGLLKLVQNWLPEGSKLNDSNMAVSGSNSGARVNNPDYPLPKYVPDPGEFEIDKGITRPPYEILGPDGKPVNKLPALREDDPGYIDPETLLPPDPGTRERPMDGQTAPDGSKPGRVWSAAQGSWVTPSDYLRGNENPDGDQSGMYKQIQEILAAQQAAAPARSKFYGMHSPEKQDPNNYDEEGSYIGP